MKILFYKPHPLALDAVKEWSEENGVEVDTIDELLNEENIEKLADYDGSVFTVANKPKDSMYEKLKDLGQKQIAVTSVGFEQIDLDLASENNLIVTNNPVYSPESIAEFTIMMMLKALRRDKQIRINQENKDFRHNDTIIGQTLKDKTVGIYGLGRIGLHVSKLAKAFGANIISYSPRDKENIEDIVEMVDSYDTMLKNSDIISIHSALTEENYHFFDKETFDKMKDGAILINCARGGLIDTKSLLDALDSGKLAYASIDVYENEGPIVAQEDPKYDDPLFDEILNHPKIDFFQHISYFTQTAINNQVKFALDSALEVLQTGDSKNRVN